MHAGVGMSGLLFSPLHKKLDDSNEVSAATESEQIKLDCVETVDNRKCRLCHTTFSQVNLLYNMYL
jgi:hypothetical protein